MVKDDTHRPLQDAECNGAKEQQHDDNDTADDLAVVEQRLDLNEQVL